jgi:hypothetical protein
MPLFVTASVVEKSMEAVKQPDKMPRLPESGAAIHAQDQRVS